MVGQDVTRSPTPPCRQHRSSRRRCDLGDGHCWSRRGNRLRRRLAGSHRQVLENPDEISKLVLQTILDAGTAFAFLPIDPTKAEERRVKGEPFGKGILAITACYRMKNVRADAKMRDD